MPMKMKHWQDAAILVIGLWMIVSPWALGFRAEALPLWNAIVVGALIGAVALYALYEVSAWQEWAAVLFGAWLVVSPWVLGFSGLSAAMLNAVLAGAAVLALALWALAADRDIGGWWSPAH